MKFVVQVKIQEQCINQGNYYAVTPILPVIARLLLPVRYSKAATPTVRFSDRDSHSATRNPQLPHSVSHFASSNVSNFAFIITQAMASDSAKCYKHTRVAFHNMATGGRMPHSRHSHDS